MAKIRCMNEKHGDNFAAYHGDCVGVVSQFPENSVDFSVYSPPFPEVFVFSESVADMGNCSFQQFSEQYSFLVREKLRATKPGRCTAVHCTDLPLRLSRDGAVGLRDFSGEIIRLHIEAGWVFYSRRTIWRDPVVAMARSKHVNLLYKQLLKDSAKSGGGVPDYLMVFVKPGVNAEPIEHEMDEETSILLNRQRNKKTGTHVFSLQQWQEWASPVWMTVDQTNVLGAAGRGVSAADVKAPQDEKHLVPLQLDVIERALIMWSNPNDIVLSPFMGIGSEGYMSLKLGRRFVGVELKEEYWKGAVRNMEGIERQPSFEFAA